MKTFEVTVSDITFMIEADDEHSARLDVEAILWQHAHDWGQVEVS